MIAAPHSNITLNLKRALSIWRSTIRGRWPTHGLASWPREADPMAATAPIGPIGPMGAPIPFVPPLDPGYRPAWLGNRNFEAAARKKAKEAR